MSVQLTEVSSGQEMVAFHEYMLFPLIFKTNLSLWFSSNFKLKRITVIVFNNFLYFGLDPLSIFEPKTPQTFNTSIYKYNCCFLNY